MRASTQKARRANLGGRDGFTLVEVLVVMLILGILAGIAIPAFFNQREKAVDASAKVQARTAQKAMATYAVDNDGKYSGATKDRLIDIETTLGDADMTVRSNANGYLITVRTEGSASAFTVGEIPASGGTYLDCAPRGERGCPDDGRW